jgi:hypothetical protein
MGLRLDLLLNLETTLIDIERYSTTHEAYVNIMDITHKDEKNTPNVTRMGNSFSSSSE